eukprot:Blabericola_migrator_1__215@NODE_1057_length_5570_cov_23_138288_g727_i0_p2_GENE_NODE_1057_length_5570_cov_23_138288_g727_i0NODE_1057_length_5570_cov_23_138288_g727_i0_p2_ORF_typecomplete_len319_score46_34PAP_central/PF04928_17/3_8e59NTP_transf_2/PF01909_23/5_3e13Polbeta/PF18765_1/0_043DUF4269/PF14091_6/0_038_NODE_1057_length_5570_cov_23_138288_g727_i044525408
MEVSASNGAHQDTKIQASPPVVSANQQVTDASPALLRTGGPSFSETNVGKPEGWNPLEGVDGDPEGDSAAPIESVSKSSPVAPPAASLADPAPSGTDGRVYRYGVTDPISWGVPSARDYQLTEALEETLTRRGLYETVEGSKHREFVLMKLDELIQEWVSEVGIGAGLSQEEMKDAGGKIFTFGSYRLGVVTPNSDIDTLCVAPHYVTREAFFTYLFAKLQQDPNVTHLQPVPDAYTPIIKLQFHGVDIDLLFARLPINKIQPDMSSLLDDEILKHVDDKTARSLNGCRVADMLLALVPDQESFRTTLRFIKEWARNR